jgi:5-aminopentanamidase
MGLARGATRATGATSLIDQKDGKHEILPRFATKRNEPMTPPWKIACVQMDCRLAEVGHNLGRIRERIASAAREGARLVLFPECTLTGYCYESKDEAWPHSETVPGPSTLAIAQSCERHNVWAIVGLLERDAQGNLFNAAALIGPKGSMVGYRKIHLPFLGVDRITTPGDRPFAVHDLGGLRVGINICYDGSFPESSRVLMLLGADLVVLPTNWPTGAMVTVQHLVQARALENHLFYAAVNRVGEERGFHFIGRSRIVDCSGTLLAHSDDENETILYATIDPARAREKQIVKIPGKYELNRVRDRRPEMYSPLTAPLP